MVARVVRKKDGWAGDKGAEGGNTPTLTSVPSKWAIDVIRSAYAHSNHQNFSTN